MFVPTKHMKNVVPYELHKGVNTAEKIIQHSYDGLMHYMQEPVGIGFPVIKSWKLTPKDESLKVIRLRVSGSCCKSSHSG